MFDFANPYLLYLLWLIPALWGIYWLARIRRRKLLARFGRPDVIAHLMPDASRYKPAIKFCLRMIALLAIIIVLARPRAGERQQDKTVAGIEVMLAFDLSNSMLASATDDPEGTSRLDRARLVLEKMIDRLDNNKVGMVVFAGDAKTQLPMTTDFYTAKMYLGELNPSEMQYQGTSLAEAIRMSMNGFGPDENVHKAIVLITDAEDHEGEAIEAAKLAADNDIQLDVVSLGTEKGAPIPLPGAKGQYMRDYEGNIVNTATNSKLAEEIAKAGKGVVVNGAANDAVDRLVDQLETLQKSEFKHISYSAAAEQFPIFAWIAFVFLILDVFVLDRKNSWLRNVNFFTRKQK